MKIGILTLPIKTNYGGILQAYALVRFLRLQGHDAWFIKRRWNAEKQNLVHVLAKWFYHHIVIRKFNSFISTYIVNQTGVIDSRNKVSSLLHDGYEAFVVGSDQIWRIRNVRGADYNYFLDFTQNQNVKRIAYAASFGVDYWDDNQDEQKSIGEIKPLIGRFDGISVREDTGVTLCKNLFGLDAEHVLDPTLLLDKEDYVANLKLTIVPKQYLAVYILDMTEDKRNMVSLLSEILNLPVKYINEGKYAQVFNRLGILSEYAKPGVKKWLTSLGESAFVITDSFHGAAFSINFQKQFIAIGNKERGLTRFTSLLKSFALEERLVLTSEDLMKINIVSSNINYDIVNMKRCTIFDKSLNFLKTHLQ